MDAHVISSQQKSLIITFLLSLGGAENIDSLSNCMSRIRVVVKNPALLGLDEDFLALNAYGVIRQRKSIHLIYQKYTMQLSHHLYYLFAFCQDRFALSLLFLSQGADNIDNITVDTGVVYISLKTGIDIDLNFLNILNLKNTVLYHSAASTIEVKTSDIDLSSKLQYGILFWDLILSQYIIENLGVGQIIDFSFYNYITKIQVHDVEQIKDVNWSYLGVTMTKSSEEQLVQLSPTQENILSILRQVLILLKKDPNRV